jgi:hypothetical protein
MSTVEEIKAAAKNLPATDKIDLYRWLDESEDVRAMRREELRREIQKGIESLDQGEGVPLDIESIKCEGRRLLAERKVNA